MKPSRACYLAAGAAFAFAASVNEQKAFAFLMFCAVTFTVVALTFDWNDA